MRRRPSLLVLTALASLGACGEGEVNPPTQPAPAVEVVDPAARVEEPDGPTLPGRGPVSFVGRWAADVSWCANTQGAERPIEITPNRFEGYENSCAIEAVDQVADGYVATLACVAEGTNSRERVKFSAADDVLRLTWLDRSDRAILLRKCTTLAETAGPGGP
jgi:hypothetical protein